jgi:hypothetical protein
MATPILFLDVDGVLNSAEWAERGTMWGVSIGSLDPEACARLERVIAATGCELVLSSSWRRYGDDPAWFEAMLHERGCASARFIGQTPSLAWKLSERGTILGVRERGDEIQAWLDGAPEHAGRPFAIVDDSSDMAHLAHRLVRTTWERGLQDEHVEALIAMLRGDSAKVEVAP